MINEERLAEIRASQDNRSHRNCIASGCNVLKDIALLLESVDKLDIALQAALREVDYGQERCKNRGSGVLNGSATEPCGEGCNRFPKSVL